MDEGFAALFEAHHDAVMRYVVRRVNRDDAPDLVAETFAVLLRSAERPADPLPWLYAVARNLIRNHRRRLVALTPSPTLADPADLAVFRADLATAFAALAEEDREVLRLVAWEGLDAASAAVVLGCSPVAFRVRLHRARRRLAALLTVVEPQLLLAPNEVLP